MNDSRTTNLFVLVFRTNINSMRQVKSISPLLDRCPEILKWNVDISDIDRVLRIESTHENCEQVIEMVTKAGYACEELTD